MEAQHVGTVPAASARCYSSLPPPSAVENVVVDQLKVCWTFCEQTRGSAAVKGSCCLFRAAQHGLTAQTPCLPLLACCHNAEPFLSPLATSNSILHASCL